MAAAIQPMPKRKATWVHLVIFFAGMYLALHLCIGDGGEGEWLEEERKAEKWKATFAETDAIFQQFKARGVEIPAGYAALKRAMTEGIHGGRTVKGSAPRRAARFKIR